MLRRSVAVLAFATLFPSRALAQANADGPTTNAVPSGQGGAVIVPPKAPAADPITPPRPLTYVAPDYPDEARRAGLEAQVILALDIDKQGHVIKAVVVEPAGHGFDEAALAAAPKLRFDPAHTADGTLVKARIRYRYAFTLTPRLPTPSQSGSAPQASAPAGRLAGSVLSASGDAAIAGALVSVAPTKAKGPAAGAVATSPGEAQDIRSDATGAFSLESLSPGPYTVTIRAPGYEPFTVEETVVAGEATELKYRLVPESHGLEVVVRGERPPREVTRRTLEPREIDRIPGTNGDAIRSIENLPGVARPPPFSGLLIVRGSGPFDTQTFIDGLPVPLIYHFGGLSSVVPTELLERIDFYPGNFGSEYGRVQGGIVDVGLRSPKNEYHGLAQYDFIDARLMLEGPIPGLKGWTFLAAGRRSHLETILGPALNAAGANVTQLPVYYDYQFMVAKDPTPASSFRLVFYGSDDAFSVILNKAPPGAPTISGVTDHTGFLRLQARYTQDFANGDRLRATVALGDDRVDIGLGSLFFNLDLWTVTARAEYTAKIVRGVALNLGTEGGFGAYKVDVNLPAFNQPGKPPNQPFGLGATNEQRLSGTGTQPAAYAELELTPHRLLRIVPGLRLDYFSATQGWDVQPRFNARVDLNHDFPRTTLKGGAGLYSQPALFQQVLPPAGNPHLASNRAYQYALGVEQEFTRNVEASLEGFYKRLDSQVVSTAAASGAASLEYTNLGTGAVVGSELLIKYKPDDRFFGWVAYTLSRSVRTDGPGQAEHLFNYDQTHILTVLGSYRLGHGWEMGARYRLVTGNPITPNVCDPTSPTCNPNRVNGLFNAASGTYTAIPTVAPFSERLPLFHQLDIRIDKTYKFKRWQLSTYLDVQNIYNQGNAEGLQYNFNYTARNNVSGLPILPSFGVRGQF